MFIIFSRNKVVCSLKKDVSKFITHFINLILRLGDLSFSFFFSFKPQFFHFIISHFFLFKHLKKTIFCGNLNKNLIVASFSVIQCIVVYFRSFHVHVYYICINRFHGILNNYRILFSTASGILHSTKYINQLYV